MSYLLIGTILLFLSTALFYIVFASLVYYYHEKKTTAVVVPLIYTFEFLLVSFLIMSLAVIVLTYWQQIAEFFLYVMGTGIDRNVDFNVPK